MNIWKNLTDTRNTQQSMSIHQFGFTGRSVRCTVTFSSIKKIWRGLSILTLVPWAVIWLYHCWDREGDGNAIAQTKEVYLMGKQRARGGA